MADDKPAFTLYYYTPSLVAAVVFIALFALCTLMHLNHLFRTRTWFFIPFCLGGFMEIIGYAGRALNHNDPTARNLYMIQSILLLLAPILFGASIYMVLSRVIRASGADSFISARWITGIFMTADILSLMTQGAGGGMMATAKDQDGVKRAEHIVLGGLGIQIIAFLVFIAAAVVAHVRENRGKGGQWGRLLSALHAASLLILVRNLYRVAEYAGGRGGKLTTSENWLYIFDGTLMVLVMGVFVAVHPGKELERLSDVERDMELRSSRV